ncbi:MAG: hypothetical protein K6F05_05820 [Succinivibrio sp.]|nr:hypothetical protein [Succinivibrio sp.]
MSEISKFTLQQFTDISSGSYNAGDLELSTKNGQVQLTKVNNHKTFTFLNKHRISEANILEIKQEFVKTLKENGVKPELLHKIEHELGLVYGDDRGRLANEAFMHRRMTPLSRQQVREYLAAFRGEKLEDDQHGDIRRNLQEGTRARLNAGLVNADWSQDKVRVGSHLLDLLAFNQDINKRIFSYRSTHGGKVSQQDNPFKGADFSGRFRSALNLYSKLIRQLTCAPDKSGSFDLNQGAKNAPKVKVNVRTLADGKGQDKVALDLELGGNRPVTVRLKLSPQEVVDKATQSLLDLLDIAPEYTQGQTADSSHAGFLMAQVLKQAQVADGINIGYTTESCHSRNLALSILQHFDNSITSQTVAKLANNELIEIANSRLINPQSNTLERIRSGEVETVKS